MATVVIFSAIGIKGTEDYKGENMKAIMVFPDRIVGFFLINA